MKKLLSIFLCLVMLLATMPYVFAEDTDVYTISTAGELRTFLNSADTYESTMVMLENDIKIYNKEFSLDENNAPNFNSSTVLPAAFPSLENFKGTFDGQNHTISGLYLNDGLFANCDGATIKNLNIDNSLIYNNSENKQGLAAISSIITNSTVTGCSVDAVVVGGGNNVGGILGKVTDCTVKQCRNLGEIYGNNYVGGFAGSINSSEVVECYNSADVVGNDNVGGFSGHAFDFSISKCYNLGDVTVFGEKGVAGGFVGYLSPVKTKRWTIQYSYNAGDVSGYDVGKFCGIFVGTYEEMFSLENCYFKGTSLKEFDADGYISMLWEMCKENPSIMYPPGTFYPGVEPTIEIEARSEERLKKSYYPFVYDYSNENEGYPMIEFFHKIHTFSEYESSEDGLLVAKCNSKGCSVTDSTPHTHSWGEYIYNNDASCVKDGTMTASCLNCSERNTINDPKHPKTEHMWGEYIYNNDATCVNYGTKTAECQVNGCEETDTIADREHPLKDHIFGTYVLDADGLTETAHCKQENCTETDTKIHLHVWGTYFYNKDADCITDGTKTASCTNKNCKVTNTITDENHLAPGHNMSNFVLNFDGLTESAFCLNDGCDEIITIEHKHTWGGYIYNNDSDCTTDGTMTGHCTKQGCVATDTKPDPENEAQGHKFGDWESNNDAKFFKNATETRTCRCGHSETQEIEDTSIIVVFFRFLTKLFETLFS